MERRYVQTITQLYHQLHQEGYSTAEIGQVRQAYAFAAEHFCCLFRPSGKTFIAHLVGTASILVSVYAPLNIVLAGLLHAIYRHGDFGTLGKAISEPKRNTVRAIIGDTAEGYVFQYSTLRWNDEVISELYGKAEKLGPVDRDVILLRLANELEDQLDHGMLYCHNAQNRLRGITNPKNLLIPLTEKLGYPILAAELSRVFKETRCFAINRDLFPPQGKQGVFRRIPFSCRQSLSHYLFQKMSINWARALDTIWLLREKGYRSRKWVKAVLQRSG